MRVQKINSDSVLNYFDNTMIIYRLYSKNHLHFGIWNRNTSNKEESLLNLTKYVCTLLDIKSNDVILDAGCGVGGSTRYIASTYGVKIAGINISHLQLQKAVRLSKNMKNGSLIKYFKQDYTETSFPPRTFTKIFGIESICHSSDKRKFTDEAYRLLKSGGKIVIADGYRKREDLENYERNLFRRFLKGWAVPNLESFDSIEQILDSSGFKNIKSHDITNQIIRASWRIHLSAKQVYPVLYVLTKLKILNGALYDHCEGAYTQKKLIDRDILRYGVITAEK
jgi:cyclopropane fatty-acyl-phospholipid synthase-like methyltransferase